MIQILEIFPATGYRNNKFCPGKRPKKLKSDNYWIKTLMTIYHNAQIERTTKYESGVPVEKLFFFIPRTKQQSARYRSNNVHLKIETVIYYKHS